MDVAASEFYKNGAYDLDFKNPKSNPSDYLSSDKLAELYLDFCKDFPMVSIEDPFDQDDWAAWSNLTSRTPIQIVGDDLTVSYCIYHTYLLLKLETDIKNQNRKHISYKFFGIARFRGSQTCEM